MSLLPPSSIACVTAGSFASVNLKVRCCVLFDREEIDQAHALSASLADVQRQGHISVINRRLAEHPMMVSSSAAAPAETSAPSTKYQGRLEDFPTLDGAQISSQPTSGESQQPKSKEPKPSTVENADAESGPRSEMSLAKKLAMSSRLSVRSGPMELADFPSLPNVRPTKTRKGPPVSNDDFPSLSSISKTKLSKTSTTSVWNTTDTGSKEHSQPSSRVGKAEHLLAKNGEDDFPSLAVTAATPQKSAISSSCSSLAEISRNFSSSSLSKMADQADTASNPPSLSWGPELSRKPEKNTERKEHDNFLHLKTNKKAGKSAVCEAWGGNSSRQTGSEMSDGVKQAASSSEASQKPSVSLAKVPPAAPSEATADQNDKRTGDRGWTHVGDEKKSQLKPSKNDDAKVRTNQANGEQAVLKQTTKSKAKSEESSLQSKTGKDKSKKKQKASKTNGEPTAEKPVQKMLQNRSLNLPMLTRNPEQTKVTVTYRVSRICLKLLTVTYPVNRSFLKLLRRVLLVFLSPTTALLQVARSRMKVVVPAEALY